MARYAINQFRKERPDWSDPVLSFINVIRKGEQRLLHEILPGYSPTPLRECAGLAEKLGLGSVLVKDESHRYGINAFKGLGASWAIFSILQKKWKEENGEELSPAVFRDENLRQKIGVKTFAAATDGNHGRAVAWTAGMLGQKAVIFMPDDTAEARIRSIEGEGARVVQIPGTFDDCVKACADRAEKEGWQVVSDTAYPGNMEIPGYIITGYSTIFAEIAEQIDRVVDALILPAGVGGLAAAGTADTVCRYGHSRPALICVEPEECACFLESVIEGSGNPITAGGTHKSIMVGLCCATPSLVAWPVIRDGMDLFLAVEDEYARDALRAYNGEGIISGESGSSTLAGLMALMRDKKLSAAKEHLGLGQNSTVLLISTEGDTDPENYSRILHSS